MPGPVPKRSDQRRRRNKNDGPKLVKASGGAAPEIPPADEDWHPIAARWYPRRRRSPDSPDLTRPYEFQTSKGPAPTPQLAWSGAFTRLMCQLACVLRVWESRR
jgi:hypothetical protein